MHNGNGPVFGSDHLELFFDDRGGDLLLITFNEMGMRANGRTFWGRDVADHLGISAAGFVSRCPNWFPAAATGEACSRLLDRIGNRFPERVTYGLSQGGYAAVKHSARLHATTVLSFSPQASIEPQVLSDRRFTKYYVQDLHADMAIGRNDVAGRVFVFADPYNADDMEHLDYIRGVVPVTTVFIPFSGHASARAFTGKQPFREFLGAAVARDVDRIRRMRGSLRRKLPNRAYNIIMELAKRKPQLAARYLDAFHAHLSVKEIANAGYRIATHGGAEAVFPRVRDVAALHADDADIWCCVALVAMRLADFRTAEAASGVVMRINPNSEKHRWIRSQALKHG